MLPSHSCRDRGLGTAEPGREGGKELAVSEGTGAQAAAPGTQTAAPPAAPASCSSPGVVPADAPADRQEPSALPAADVTRISPFGGEGLARLPLGDPALGSEVPARSEDLAL